MKRIHVHVRVGDLSENIRFYSALFGAEPTVLRGDYAKWRLEDPRLNFAISTSASARGVDHLGIEVDSDAELAEIGARGRAAELASRAETDARCCYAQSNKRWFEDPQTVKWETFHTLGLLETFGEDRDAAASRPVRCCA